jgi:hypothetical protein
MRLLNSQLRGELQQLTWRKGLQPVALSLCGFAACLLFPVTAFLHLMLSYITVCQICAEMSRGLLERLSILAEDFRT